MSPDVEQPLPTPDVVARHPHRGSHHLLRGGTEDRWPWRARIRQNPHQLRVYRVLVGFLGLLLILLGCATGWLPGPGGIPLVLLGLAVWASEFAWANRLMQRFKRALHHYAGWGTRRKVGFWVAFVAGCGLLGYGYLLVLGSPTWFPDAAEQLLARLPGI